MNLPNLSLCHFSAWVWSTTALKKVFIRSYHEAGVFAISFMFPSFTTYRIRNNFKLHLIPSHCITTLLLNVEVFICRNTQVPLIIWQLILPYEILQGGNICDEILMRILTFQVCTLCHLSSENRKWILKHKLWCIFPLKFGFYIPWEQGLCVLLTFVISKLSQYLAQNRHSINVYGIRSRHHSSQPEIHPPLAPIKQYMKSNNLFI